MTELFYTILNMSISASILVLVVLLLRLVFRRAPKWVSVLLWGLVAIRLICPFAPETQLSLMPEREWVTEDAPIEEENMWFDSVAPERLPVDTPADPAIGPDDTFHYYPLDPPASIRRNVSLPFVMCCIWLAGVAGMLAYMLVSYLCVLRRVRSAKLFRDNIYISESVASPFVLGFFRPRIYLPENMDAVSMSYVIAHEEAHLRRRDHLWKPFGFLLLAVHWFNPLIWLAYILLCRDIEMACDERVVRGMNEVERADYSEALLECSVSRRLITACPLAFGETGVKERIRSVLNYKKPVFWIIVLAVIACAVVAVCFLTDPVKVIDTTVTGIRFPVNDPHAVKECTVEINGEISYDTFRGTVTVDGRRIETTVDMTRDTPPLSYYEGPKLRTYGLFFILRETFTEFVLEIDESDEYVVCGMSLEQFEAEMKKKNYYVAYLHDIVLYDIATADRAQVLSDINTDGRTVVLYGKYLDPDAIADQFYFGDNVVGKPHSSTNSHKTVYYACMSTCLDGKIYTKQSSVTFADDFSDTDIEEILGDHLDIADLRKSAYEFRQDKLAEYSILDTAPLYGEKTPLTLTDVISLSAEGESLTWEDFAGYACRDVGSGLYVCRYDIDDTFYLLIGDGKLTGTPMYIRLVCSSADVYADVTTDDVRAFVDTYTYTPALSHPFADAGVELKYVADKDAFSFPIVCHYAGKTITVHTPKFTGIPTTSVYYQMNFQYKPGGYFRVEICMESGGKTFLVDRDGRIVNDDYTFVPNSTTAVDPTDIGAEYSAGDGIYIYAGDANANGATLYGLMDNAGKAITTAQYTSKNIVFSLGYAMAQKADGTWVGIDIKGNEYNILPATGSIRGTTDVVQEGEPGAYVQYLHDADGKRLSDGYDSISYFFGGLALIEKDNKMGLIAQDGTVVLPPTIAFDTVRWPTWGTAYRGFHHAFMDGNTFLVSIGGEMAVITVEIQ